MSAQLTNDLTALGMIVLSDLAFSADNALVIGAAVVHLSGVRRRRAVALGTLGAVALRVFFTLFAGALLHWPLLGALGGATLVWIAFRLLADTDAPATPRTPRVDVRGALTTIMLADASMSLDNALAVAGASHGQPWLVVTGLGLSIPLLMLGASAVSGALARFPGWRVGAGAVIVWIGADLVRTDPTVAHRLTWLVHPWTLPVAALTILVALLIAVRVRSSPPGTILERGNP